MRLRIAIHGAAGRMGRRLVALGIEDPELTIHAALEGAHHPRVGDDAGLVAGVGEIYLPISSQLPKDAQAVIDFSVPSATIQVIRECIEKNMPIVVATTGLGEEGDLLVRQAAESIPLVWAPNMSLAVNLGMKLAETTATALATHAAGVDVEILDRHHRFKEDAPSGTALKFGEIVASRMGQTQHTHGRTGRPGVRPQSEIAYHAIRAGDNPGEHTIVFGMLGETIEISVRATSRDCYALGALQAAKFVTNQPPGLYSMWDVLGLS